MNEFVFNPITGQMDLVGADSKALAELEENLQQTIADESTTRAEQIDELNEQKQGKTDENLQTADKTIVGAINEVKTQVDNFGIEHSYTIDFYTTSTLSQDMNIAGDISIEAIEMRNVTTLYLSYTGVVKKAITAAELPLSIPNNTVLNWEIVRTTDNELACIGISYVKQQN